MLASQIQGLSIIKSIPCPCMQILVANCIWTVALQKAWISGSPLSCPFQGDFYHERIKLQLLRLSDELARPTPLSVPGDFVQLQFCKAYLGAQWTSDGSVPLNTQVPPICIYFPLCSWELPLLKVGY